MNLVALAISFVVTGLCLQALRPIAAHVSLVDLPSGRKNHTTATPMVGGIGIFLGTLLAVTFTPGLLTQFAPLFSLSALVLFVGVIDDAKELSADLRMAGHGLIALCMPILAGVELHSLGNLIFSISLTTGVLSIPLTVFATVGVINAINMSDGIDGLSGGFAVITLGMIALATSWPGNVSIFSLILICSILAFLVLNFRYPWKKKALVYMGDAGSTTIGFILAWLLIENSQGNTANFAPVHALWFLAVPLMDTVNLLIKRPLQGRSPFHPGHDHLHHKLQRRGLSDAKVVSLLLAISLFLGCLGLLGLIFQVKESIMFTAFMALFALYYFASEHIAPPTKTNDLGNS